ncbi:leukocyte immunoglobulin-like receptor subfamily A member 4 isoform X2 [Monodelphis domestica]|uniref:leukocyte immunoglobulin-like receptor subfamily A member 4 isoform X2 n=1 Tax=Monodelphis domestica TaxID=13616 RepID=UPI0024E24D84|nr:leukocyte immunoglobulin-like receptor subfamily A member 4 isoform X2 [Monodelphis domestica]
MAAASWALLCLLGLWLVLRIRALEEDESALKPSISVSPGPIVSEGGSVTFWCRGPIWADGYRLEKEGLHELRSMPWPGSQVYTAIESVISDSAGRYSCRYEAQGVWSDPSEPLELVVTGLFPSPSLSVLPSPSVVLGDKVTLQCSSKLGFGIFKLVKEGGGPPATRAAQGNQADFVIAEATLDHQGTYQCFGLDPRYPQEWSSPSNAVALSVAQDVPKDHKHSSEFWFGNPGPHFFLNKLSSEARPGVTLWDSRGRRRLVHMVLAGLILLVLVAPMA